ncbi:hypothetical protein ACFQI3_00870 [Hansschlegelia quercus]|uniref:Uncharacterized protein n=1 Tax=Hansschlegelia quercus TaxID=2528245 RepID=A0A4Q9GJH0_9HYPH|nr:hypothetical protein [Hansschlegelia quercus]TBN51732.1 hypothetical protein EYR15_12510 [Hansschlegelia quercus]
MIDRMADQTITAEALDAIDVSEDGAAIRVCFRGADGQDANLFLPGECAGQLAMSLPRAVRTALRLRHRDDSLRMVFPVGGWTIEASTDRDTMILTISTPDGFEASYALNRSGADDLAQSLSDAPANMPVAILKN